ncbi:formylglycine-generating enzyme family protein [bacterium]|nr:formylglycine-generating enzyme family protein [bacterium]MBU1025830.1 formylglycine-generating enzyme family protein [bacterium]
MNISRIVSLIVLLTAIFFLGCSSSSVEPQAVQDSISPDFLLQDDSRIIGAGSIEIDPTTMTANVIPNRTGDFHYVVTGYMGGCTGGCFRFQILDITDNIFTVKLTLENPTNIQVWDVRIFLFNIEGKKILNPDGYSDMYTAVQWIPFLNFNKEDPERVMPAGPGTIDTEILLIDFSGGSNPGIDYLIEAGVNEQFVEPVQIDPPIVEGVFFSNYGIGARIKAYVHDHQSDANVSLDGTPVGLAADLPMYDDGLHGDELADDGIFGSDFIVPAVGAGPNHVTVEAYAEGGWPKITRPVAFKVYPVPEMINIPAGDFTMGCPEGDPYWDNSATDDEKPLHTHITGAYDIGKYEVTNAQFAAFVENGGYLNPVYWSEIGWLILQDGGMSEPYYWRNPSFSGPNKQNYPVIGLMWYEVEAFCNWFTEVTGDNWRLPSEAEWEKAARGDMDVRYYPWGTTWNNNWCNSARDTIYYGTSPVGAYSPQGDSPYGCADMLGNAIEWTNDWYSGTIYTQYEQGNFNPPASGSSKVTRGGVWWVNNRYYLRVSHRWNKGLMDTDDGNGFRLVRDVP